MFERGRQGRERVVFLGGLAGEGGRDEECGNENDEALHVGIPL